QVYENYKRKNTDGVSITFLLLWIFGDVFNLFGALLGHLMITMLLLALYYLFADCLLMGQVIYYRLAVDQPKVDEVLIDDTARIGTIPASATETTVAETTPLLSERQGGDYTHKKATPSTRRIIRMFCFSSIFLMVGLLGGCGLYFFWPGLEEKDQVDLSQLQLWPQLLGWASAILYCGSRIPQIMQNFEHESVEGLSLVMFVFSVVGNITYCVSILLKSLDRTFLLINFPWLLGSGGTLFFDFTIFFQFYIYGGESKLLKE
ncbi:hypothetical protein DFQ30_009942, partial [Apophysomyces sp. BC1015]